ncbi:MAG TPA: ABC transporter substrate binding protein [Gammaproteobacteria bacterium]
MTYKRRTKQHSVPYGMVFLLSCFILLNTLFTAQASPEEPSVLLIADGNNALMQTFSAQLNESLKQHKIDLRSINLEDNNILTPADLYPHDLIITLGSSAADKILGKNINKPVLSTLIPQQTFNAITSNRKYNKEPWSALLIDQPIKRQLLLIKHLFGKQETIGTILGPYSSSMEKELTEQSRKLNQTLFIEKIQATDELIFSLNKLSGNSGVLLAIPDPVAFNKNTIRSILLSTYRHRIPVVGFSQSYVKAGAVASLHTDISQIAEQAANLTQQFFVTGKFSRSLYYPAEFSVSYNRMVANSLNQDLPDSEKLIQLIKMDEQKP